VCFISDMFDRLELGSESLAASIRSDCHVPITIILLNTCHLFG